MNTGNYTQLNIDKNFMKLQNHDWLPVNIYNRNADKIKDLESELWALMAEIRINKAFLKKDASNEKQIAYKHELEAKYQRLSNAYCFANPFSQKDLKLN